MDELTLVPECEMPAVVRGRIRDRVFDEIEADRRGRTTRWVPVAAAVAAALLVSGVSALSGSLVPGPSAISGQPGPSEQVPGVTDDAAVLDRCWDAVATGPAASRFPPRSEWVQAVKAVGGDSVVVGYRAAHEVVFCEVTASGATVSDPTATPERLPGTPAEALLITPAGSIGGVVDPAAPALTISVTSPGWDSYSGPATERGGLFVFLSVVATDGASITASTSSGEGSPAVALRRPAPPAVSAPTGGPASADRSSERGRLLAACLRLARAFVPTVGAETWQPGATVAAGGERVVMAVGGGQVGACVQTGRRAQVLSGVVPSPGSRAGAPVLAALAPALDGRPLLAGSLPAAAVRVELDLPDGTVAEADVAGSTFAVLLPSAMAARPPGPVIADLDGIRWRIYDASGALLFDDHL